MGTSLPLLIRRMTYGEFDLISLIIGVIKFHFHFNLILEFS